MTTETLTGAWARGRTEKVRARSGTPLLAKAAYAIARRTPRWAAVRSAALTTGGLGAIDYGLYELHPIAGIIASGVSLLILEWAVRE